MAKPGAQRSCATVHASRATTIRKNSWAIGTDILSGTWVKEKPNDKAEPQARERERSRQETNLLGVFIEDTLASEDVSRDTNEKYLEDRLQHHNHRISRAIGQGVSARPLTSKVVLRRVR